MVVLFAETLTNEEIQELLFGAETDLDVDSDSGDEAKQFQLESVLHSKESSNDACSEDENDEKENVEKRSPPEHSHQKAAQSWMTQIPSTLRSTIPHLRKTSL